MINIIVAGSRSIKDSPFVYEWLNLLISNVDCIISGMANGVDTIAYNYAKERNITVIECPAKWNDINSEHAIVKINKFGKQYNVNAGFERNQYMADIGTHLIAFNDYRNGKGTSGTNDMIKRAKKNGLLVKEIKYYGNE